ncbi:oligosaccharide flippase family protein [Aliterella atlantica]|uniref:Polysaccharide biosynthesis protein n=1 Tax=Aliterella atlantica CENA595 TaxID=1618023 RepID=A0A0D8ZVS6_9CYAN|nr:oligosaccharide flippase family protein [Aliterella atlantica]KJH72559.1 polysaccharide biosynthesis protein [Aliterella atlantica CENA595]
MNFSKLKLPLTYLKQNSLAKNTLWMLLAQGLRLVLQAGYFVIIARVLGPEQYGAFVGVTALISILAPFASLGSGNLLIKNVSRNKALFAEYWGNALWMIVVSGLGLFALVLLIAPATLPKTIPLALIVLVCLTDLIFARILDVAGQAFQAVLWLSKTAQLNILPQVTRIIAALALVSLFAHPQAKTWTFLYLISTAVSALIAVFLVHRSLGYPKLALWRIKPEIAEGFYFSIGLSAQTVYNDIDKTMLARLATLSATGIYASAYRLIDVAFVPVRSLLAAAYTKFFQHGASGITGTMSFAKRLLPLAALYGVGVGIALFCLAPVVPYILGSEYQDAIAALRWLAPLPLLKSLHYFAADTLTGAGFQGIRSAMQAIVAIFNVSLNLWLIPTYSWQGAAWASLASDGFLVLSLWIAVAFIYRQQLQTSEEKA